MTSTTERNIFGGVGCKFPDGSMCTLCCTLLIVDSPELNKPQETHCVYQCDTGCVLHNLDKQPRICKTYRCETDEDSQRVGLLLASALEAGKITAAQFRSLGQERADVTDLWKRMFGE